MKTDLNALLSASAFLDSSLRGFKGTNSNVILATRLNVAVLRNHFKVSYAII